MSLGSISSSFVDVYEAAAELGVSKPTIYRLMKEHQVKRYKFPGNRRTHIRRSDLEKLKLPQEKVDTWSDQTTA